MSEREFIRDGGVLTPDEELDKLEPLGDRFNQSPDKVFIPDTGKYSTDIKKQLDKALKQ